MDSRRCNSGDSLHCRTGTRREVSIGLASSDTAVSGERRAEHGSVVQEDNSLKLPEPALSRMSSSADIIRVTLLGTGTPYPNAARLGSAILVEGGGERLLFDCGRGVV